MEQQFYDIEAVSKILGIGLTKTRELVSNRVIPSIRLADSRIRRVPATLLEQWIKEQTALALENQAP